MIKIYVYESVWCSVCYTLLHLFRSKHGRQTKILLFSTFVFQEGHIQLEETMPRLSSRIALRAGVCAFCGLRGTVWLLNNGLIQVELLSLIFLSPINNPPLKLFSGGRGGKRCLCQLCVQSWLKLFSPCP